VRRAEQADGIVANVVVVNNSNDAQSLAEAVDSAGGAKIIQNSANLGFSAACNIGAAHGDANLILFLNPDAALTEGCLGECVSFLNDSRNAGVGILGPRLMNPEGAPQLSCSALPSALDLIWRSLGLHLVFRGHRDPYLSIEAHDRSGDVGQVMGAAMFMRRSVYAALRGFDEAFFLYYEDVDICARAAAVNVRSHYLKTAHALHVGAGSSSHNPGQALGFHVVSRLTYARRHFGHVTEVAVLFSCLFVEFPARAARALIRGERVRPIFQGFLMAAARLARVRFFARASSSKLQ
jgi:GT2 family glycosyltransferase